MGLDYTKQQKKMKRKKIGTTLNIYIFTHTYYIHPVTT